MSEPLRQLIASSAFLILHENLEKWLMLYENNTCDQNIATGCEIIELNARLQGQLFRLISICASEGGVYGGANAIKSRLLPLLGSGFFSSGLTSSTSLNVLASSSSRMAELTAVRKVYDKSLERLESDLEQTNRKNSWAKYGLHNTKGEHNVRKHGSKSYKEGRRLHDLQSRMQSLEMENQRLQTKLTHSSGDIRRLDQEKMRTGTNSDMYLMDDGAASVSSHLNGISPLSSQDPVQRGRQHRAVMRFNELFSGSRIETMSVLRRHLDDHDMNQSIVFQTVMEAFSVAKGHFRAYRDRLRSKMATTSTPSAETLNELVQSHINVHASYSADFPAMTHEVLLAMERHVPRLRRPSTAIGFEMISDFIYEACKLAWECSILAHPLDVYRPACVNEVLDETKYRRSHDSSYSAVLIHHHIWPCLIQEGYVIAKGEVCTRRNRPMDSIRHMSPDLSKATDRVRSRNQARSCSPPMGRTPSPRLLDKHSLNDFERRPGSRYLRP